MLNIKTKIELKKVARLPFPKLMRKHDGSIHYVTFDGQSYKVREICDVDGNFSNFHSYITLVHPPFEDFAGKLTITLEQNGKF